MEKRIGIFLDVSNIFKCVRLKHKYRRLDYAKYLEYCSALGTPTVKIAYGTKTKSKAGSFIQILKNLGLTIKYKTPKIKNPNPKYASHANCNVDITVDIVEKAKDLDMIILGSSDTDMIPCVEWVESQGKICVVLAAGIRNEFRSVATKAIELPESLLCWEKRKR